MSPTEAYQAGTAAFNAGQFDRAYDLLRRIQHPQALHLAAISAQKLGHTSNAAKLFRNASKLAPNDPNVANNYGHFQLAQNDLAAATAQFERALKLAPNLPAALIGLAKVEAAQKNWSVARDRWAKVLEAAPQSAVGQYGFATALLETGDAERAADRFRSILNQRSSAEPMFMLGRALLEQNQFAEAETCFRTSFEQSPSEHAFRNLANLLWMQGETDKFEQFLGAAPAGLKPVAIRLILESGDLERANQVWQNVYAETSPGKDAWLLKGAIARELQDAAELSAAADRALEQDRQDLIALDLRIVADLMQGDPQAALRRLGPLRRAHPNAQHWLAHEFIAHRLLGTESPLLEVDRFVRAYDLDVPAGFASMDVFNSELAAELKKLHGLESRPLNQSLRGAGTQTTRSLTDYTLPVIDAYVRGLNGPIQKYLADIGRDAGHPTSVRNASQYQFAGMWSVILRGRGYHEKHVHPEGWISSAYYVSVPPDTEASPDRAGWIGFGAPPYLTSPALEELKWIAPKPGRVVLFPSFMWHGTNPIDDQAERITAPFDLIP